MYQRPRRTLDSVSVVHLRLIWYVEYVSAIFLDRRGILESLQNIYQRRLRTNCILTSLRHRHSNLGPYFCRAQSSGPMKTSSVFIAKVIDRRASPFLSLNRGTHILVTKTTHLREYSLFYHELQIIATSRPYGRSSCHDSRHATPGRYRLHFKRFSSAASH